MPAPHILRIFAATALIAASAGMPAFAERADRDKPLQIESDRLSYDDSKQVATFTGNVVATKGTITIRGNTMVLRQDAAGNQRGMTSGSPATFRQKREGLEEFIEGAGQEVDYDASAEVVQVRTGAVLRKLTRGRVTEEVYGQLIVYDGKNDSYTVDGSGTRAPSGVNPGGRVRIVIQPKAATSPPGAQPAAPASAPLELKPADSLSKPQPAESR